MGNDWNVFVYGTLKPGGHYWPEFCEGKLASEPVAAKVRGQLHDLHLGYPGLLLKGDAWVVGYVLEFATEADFLRLDYLEGYVPGRTEAENEYTRLRVDCFAPEGDALGEVWVYEMTAATMERHGGTLIENGDWPV
ncbi:MAG TPA: hypothetical protein DCY38_03695 [Opitutae bacterium]|nr:hypothetical protein [Opitutae bacterium]